MIFEVIVNSLLYIPHTDDGNFDTEKENVLINDYVLFFTCFFFFFLLFFHQKYCFSPADYNPVDSYDGSTDFQPVL